MVPLTNCLKTLVPLSKLRKENCDPFFLVIAGETVKIGFQPKFLPTDTLK